MPLVFAVLFVKNQTPLFNAGMQWANQTYNAGMNYGNRNASSNYTNQDLLRGYLGAVVVSCGLSYSVRRIFAQQLGKMKGPKVILANALINLFAAAPAGAANTVLMRYKELESGITIQNERGDVDYGVSRAAGRKAVTETALTRCILPMPVLFFPAVSNLVLRKVGLMPKGSAAANLIELTLVLASLTFALPMSIALFQQRASLSRSQIDEEF